MHTQVREEAGIFAEVSHCLLVHGVNFVEKHDAVRHVMEVFLLASLLKFGGEAILDARINKGLFGFRGEGADLVGLGGEAYTQEGLEEVAQAEVGNLVVEELHHKLFSLDDVGPLERELAILLGGVGEHLELVLALILLDVFRSKRKACEGDGLPLLLLQGLLDKALV